MIIEILFSACAGWIPGALHSATLRLNYFHGGGVFVAGFAGAEQRRRRALSRFDSPS
jgi:hypothetical protein